MKGIGARGGGGRAGIPGIFGMLHERGAKAARSVYAAARERAVTAADMVTKAARERRPRFFLVFGAAFLLVVVIFLLLIAGFARRDARTGDGAGPDGAVSRTATGEARAVTGEKTSGPSSSRAAINAAAILRELKMPSGVSGDVPLDRLPKGVYTVEDALAVMPELGAIDRSRLSSRRKAHIEALFETVD